MDLSNGVPGVTAPPPCDFEEFWAYYLTQHLHPTTRQLHVIGTTVALSVGTLGLLRGRFGRVLLSPLYAYGPAFASHYLFEKNRPAALGGQAWWSARADLRMVWRTFDGSIERDVETLRRALDLRPDEVTLADHATLHAA